MNPVFPVCLEGLREGGCFPRGPADFDFADGFVFSQTKMGDGCVEGMEPAAGLDFAKLMSLSVFSIVDDDFTSDALAIALFIF